MQKSKQTDKQTKSEKIDATEGVETMATKNGKSSKLSGGNIRYAFKTKKQNN